MMRLKERVTHLPGGPVVVGYEVRFTPEPDLIVDTVPLRNLGSKDRETWQRVLAQVYVERLFADAAMLMASRFAREIYFAGEISVRDGVDTAVRLLREAGFRAHAVRSARPGRGDVDLASIEAACEAASKRHVAAVMRREADVTRAILARGDEPSWGEP